MLWLYIISQKWRTFCTLLSCVWQSSTSLFIWDIFNDKLYCGIDPIKENISTDVFALHRNNLDCIWSRLNSVHVHYIEETWCDHKNAFNECESSCNVCESSCEAQKFRSQSGVKWSCANCERGFREPELELKSLFQTWRQNV